MREEMTAGRSGAGCWRTKVYGSGLETGCSPFGIPRTVVRSMHMHGELMMFVALSIPCHMFPSIACRSIGAPQSPTSSSCTLLQGKPCRPQLSYQCRPRQPWQ